MSWAVSEQYNNRQRYRNWSYYRYRMDGVERSVGVPPAGDGARRDT